MRINVHKNVDLVLKHVIAHPKKVLKTIKDTTHVMVQENILKIVVFTI